MSSTIYRHAEGRPGAAGAHLEARTALDAAHSCAASALFRPTVYRRGVYALRGYSSQYWRKPRCVASWCGWARSFSTSMSMPSPGAVGKSIQPSCMVSDAVAISRQRSWILTKYSVIRKFGMTAERCKVAARPTSVLLYLCGDITTAWSWAEAVRSRIAV